MNNNVWKLFNIYGFVISVFSSAEVPYSCLSFQIQSLDRFHFSGILKKNNTKYYFHASISSKIKSGLSEPKETQQTMSLAG